MSKSNDLTKMKEQAEDFSKSISQDFKIITEAARTMNTAFSAISFPITAFNALVNVVGEVRRAQDDGIRVSEKYSKTIKALKGSAEDARDGLDSLRESIGRMSQAEAASKLKKMSKDVQTARAKAQELYNRGEDAEASRIKLSIDLEEVEGLGDKFNRASESIKSASQQGLDKAKEYLKQLENGGPFQEFKDGIHNLFNDGLITESIEDEFIKVGARLSAVLEEEKLLIEQAAKSSGDAGKVIKENSKAIVESYDDASASSKELKDEISQLPAAAAVMPQVGDTVTEGTDQIVEGANDAANAVDDLNEKLNNLGTGGGSGGEEGSGGGEGGSWADGFAQSANKFKEEWTSAASIAQKQFNVLARGIEDMAGMAVDSIFDGAEFRVDQLFEDIAKQLLKIAMTNMMVSAISGAMGFAGFGGPQGASATFHGGGIAGFPDANSGRRVSPFAFAGAPRYHTGGIAGLRSDEVPAILQRGEGIFTRAQMQAIGGGLSAQPHIEINFIDQTSGGTNVQAEETPTANGGMRLDLTIIDVVNGNISSGGKLDQTIRGKYGLNARPNGR